MTVPSAQASWPQSREAAGHTRCLCDTGTSLMWAGDRASHPLRLPSPASCGASNNNTQILMTPGAWAVHFFPNIKMPFAPKATLSSVLRGFPGTLSNLPILQPRASHPTHPWLCWNVRETPAQLRVTWELPRAATLRKENLVQWKHSRQSRHTHLSFSFFWKMIFHS